MNVGCQVWFFTASMWPDEKEITSITTDNSNLLKLPRPKHQRGFNHYPECLGNTSAKTAANRELRYKTANLKYAVQIITEVSHCHLKSGLA